MLILKKEPVALQRLARGPASDHRPFARFSLQGCRPMGVSDKLENGDDDVQDATLHTDGKMISTVYDRREVKRAKPVM